MTAKHGSELILFLIVFVSAAFLFLCNALVKHNEIFRDPDKEYEWVLRGLLNILGYSTILVPGYLVYVYVRSTNYLDRPSGGCSKLISRCFGEDELLEKVPTGLGGGHQRTTLQTALLLLFYFAGLQVSFLSWGILQEKIMTQKYINAEDLEGRFKDSQFLVFVNRILAFLMSGLVIICSRQPRNRCPLYKYVFCSISNILSSWCQYEALKYVSFPHQVLAKASKTIPVMIMGKIVSRTKYEYYEYVTAFILSIGMLFFMLDTGHSTDTITTFSGVILLIIYIIFDSFTSNWQGALFKQFGMSPVQMMCGVNFFSCIFTAVSLLQQGTFIESINFMITFPRFIIDCVLLSFCSAAGQLFIFNTIATFGPLVFAIISTVRQGFAVFLSCLIFDHHIDILGVFGVLLVFLSIFLRIYCSYRLKSIRKKATHNALKI